MKLSSGLLFFTSLPTDDYCYEPEKLMAEG